MWVCENDDNERCVERDADLKRHDAGAYPVHLLGICYSGGVLTAGVSSRPDDSEA
jgi:hypothetical protein